jgi:hypothetical protein
MLFASQRIERADADVTPLLRTTAERLISTSPLPDQASQVQKARAAGRQEDTLYYDNMTNVNSIGMNTSDYHWGAAVRFTPTELGPYAGYDLIAVVVYRAAYTTANDSIVVYGEGSDTLPGAVLSGNAWSPTTGAWNRFDLPAPVPISGTEDIWIADHHTESPGGFPSGCGPGPYVAGKGDWVCDSSLWYELGPLGLNYNWNIWAIVEPGGGPSGLTWDFETGLQDWTHSNGLAFPAGWDVEVWNVNGNTNATSPSPGDSSMWIDSDAAGSGVIVNDTAWSPELFPNPTMQWFKWGCGYQNYAGIDTFTVGIREKVGGMWQPSVRLRTYTTDIGPDVWDSVDVSAYASAEAIQLWFAYNYGDYTWYASFDNVWIDANMGGGPVSYMWDFEDGLQSWTHTNGQPFPAGWDVEASGLHSAQTPPDAGDSTMWVDSDAAGSGAGLIADTAKSPAVVPPAGMNNYKWGFCNYGGSGSYINDLYVGINHYTSFLDLGGAGALSQWCGHWSGLGFS